MVLNEGDKVHVILRRFFEDEPRRHFMGEVISSSESVARVFGLIYVLDTAKMVYVAKKEPRTRILSLIDSGNIINILPAEADLAKAVYTTSSEGQLVVTDHETFTLDIHEFGALRQKIIRDCCIKRILSACFIGAVERVQFVYEGLTHIMRGQPLVSICVQLNRLVDDDCSIGQIYIWEFTMSKIDMVNSDIRMVMLTVKINIAAP